MLKTKKLTACGGRGKNRNLNIESLPRYLLILFPAKLFEKKSVFEFTPLKALCLFAIIKSLVPNNTSIRFIPGTMTRLLKIGGTYIVTGRIKWLSEQTKADVANLPRDKEGALCPPHLGNAKHFQSLWRGNTKQD
ncbi:hypothetical protein NPIL_540221 [Nephila pilipes]|uniref:Uncharacterized protein n=1 Tax=Nephila pilipes TaxID=299642 RepID=A0A8X6N426_NEPPI|nr:hypothetical protein NPIL_540221 [Nephila pilipes]